MIEYAKYHLSGMFEKGYAVFSMWFTVFSALVGKYIFNDPDYLRFLFTAICLDTFFGIVKAVKQGGLRSLSLKAAEGFAMKCVMNFGALVLCHVVVNFTIQGKPNGNFNWLFTIMYGYLICKEAASVARNMNAVYPGIIPTFFIDRLNAYIKSGKLSDLKNDPQPNQPTYEHSATNQGNGHREENNFVPDAFHVFPDGGNSGHEVPGTEAGDAHSD